MGEISPRRANFPPGPLAELIPGHAPAGQIVVRAGGRLIIDDAAGASADNDGTPIAADTLFDLASVTKVFTALAFMRLVEMGIVGLDDAAHRVLPDLVDGATAATGITWRHLLTHTSGLPAGVALTEVGDPVEARRVALAVAPTAPPGTAVTYSDVGFMALGFAIEALVERPLDDAVRQLVIAPLGLGRTTFRPAPSMSIAPTEVCPWRRRRLRGEVHDENAAALGGVAGHAGLFSTADELARLGSVLLDGGSPILLESTVMEMTREQARDGSIRRGLGFSLWSPDPDASSHPFGARSFGHTGFTGTSLWIDPDRSLVVALLTNKVFRGRDFGAFDVARLRVHGAIAASSESDVTPAGAEVSR